MPAECAGMRTRHTRHTPNTAYISSWTYLYFRKHKLLAISISTHSVTIWMKKTVCVYYGTERREEEKDSWYITREWRLLWAYCHLCNHRICNPFDLYTCPVVPRLRSPYPESHSLGLATSPPARDRSLWILLYRHFWSSEILLNFVIFTGKNHGYGVAVVACMACMARVEGLLGATQFRV